VTFAPISRTRAPAIPLLAASSAIFGAREWFVSVSVAVCLSLCLSLSIPVCECLCVRPPISLLVYSFSFPALSFSFPPSFLFPPHPFPSLRPFRLTPDESYAVFSPVFSWIPFLSEFMTVFLIIRVVLPKATPHTYSLSLSLFPPNAFVPSFASWAPLCPPNFSPTDSLPSPPTIVPPHRNHSFTIH